MSTFAFKPRYARTPKIKDKTLLPRIVRLVQEKEKLSDFGKSFSKSVLKQVKKNKGLSQKQINLVERLEKELKEYEKPLTGISADLVGQIKEAQNASFIMPYDKKVLISFEQQLKSQKKLSISQFSYLDKLLVRYNSAAQEAYKIWSEDFQNPANPYIKNWNFALDYYDQNKLPYYQEINGLRAYAKTNNKIYVPQKDTYDRLMENKYVRRLLSARDAAPKYESGDIVIARARAPWRTALEKNAKYVVINNNVRISSAARGGREVALLKFGERNHILVEERWIKKTKKQN